MATEPSTTRAEKIRKKIENIYISRSVLYVVQCCLWKKNTHGQSSHFVNSLILFLSKSACITSKINLITKELVNKHENETN